MWVRNCGLLRGESDDDQHYCRAPGAHRHGAASGSLIELKGGDDPRDGNVNDPLNFSGCSVLLYGSALVETWAPNSIVKLSGTKDVKVLTPPTSRKSRPDTWGGRPGRHYQGLSALPDSGILPADVKIDLLLRPDNQQEMSVTITLAQGASCRVDRQNGGLSAMI